DAGGVGRRNARRVPRRHRGRGRPGADLRAGPVRTGTGAGPAGLVPAGSPAPERVSRSGAMTVFRLGINTCFAVKRWPQPADWAAIARDELGLDLVQHSLDLVDFQTGRGRTGSPGRSTAAGLPGPRPDLALDVHRAGRLLSEPAAAPGRAAPVSCAPLVPAR